MKKMKRKVITFQSYVSGTGIKKDEIPCDNFDDLPDVTTPAEAVLKLLAGGQAQDFARRQVYYDTEEFEDYKADYACDYIQQYKDLMEAKAARYAKEADMETADKPSTQAAAAAAEQEASSEASQEAPLQGSVEPKSQS